MDKTGCVRMRKAVPAYLLTWSVLLTLVSPCAAAMVQKLQVAEGIVGTAIYTEGSADAFPVLILHGFMQTDQFPTVRRLADSLAESDYTVLTPTLSLGITERKQSQACEALHLQTLQDDVAELAQWVDWLYRKHQRKVVLIGHSAGGHVITRYLHEYPDAPVEQVLLISLGYPVGHPLKSKLNEPDAVAEYTLGFCQRYPTTVRAFDSYVSWGPEEMLETLQKSLVDIFIIVGSEDKRIQISWVDRLRSTHLRLSIIEGANHFFDSAYEFDLQETVESVL